MRLKLYFVPDISIDPYRKMMIGFVRQKSRGVCETLQYAPGGNKVEKAIFSFKVKVKVTRSLSLVSFERASSMHANYEVSISFGSKVIAKVKVDNRQTNRQTGQKQYAPDHSIRGHKKRQMRDVTLEDAVSETLSGALHCHVS